MLDGATILYATSSNPALWKIANLMLWNTIFLILWKKNKSYKFYVDYIDLETYEINS